MANNKQIRNVAIVGTGVIGASWAALYLARGLNVTATDPAPDAEANLRRYIDAAWKDLTIIGLSQNASRDHLKFTPDLKKALADADLVQENGPERKDFKIKLFADIDAATRPDAIIASSSSGLTMSTMQSACKHPERCVIGHPFNPPHVVPLVEVVAGEKTSPETVQRALSFYESVGKKPIHVRKEVVGHVANRLQAALYREVVHLIEQGVLDVADSDAAGCWGPGLRWGVMGPNLLFHLARTTGEMEQKIWTHHPPTESRSPAHGRVRVSDIQYALLDEVNDLTVQRSLKAVGDVADDFFADMNRFLANRFVKGERTLDSFRRCFFARDYFNEWHHVRRIERMADDATFGMLTGGLHRSYGQSG